MSYYYQAVREKGNEVIACPEEDAEYWGVYKRLPDGTSTLIADFVKQNSAEEYCRWKNSWNFIIDSPEKLEAL